jgi:hypothetical protein
MGKYHMTKTWEEEVCFMENKIKKELGPSFSNEKERIGETSNIFLLLFTHKHKNDKIFFELVKWKTVFVEITVQKKKRKQNIKNYELFEDVKHNIFDLEQQNEIFKAIRTYKKEIEIRNMF